VLATTTDSSVYGWGLDNVYDSTTNGTRQAAVQAPDLSGHPTTPSATYAYNGDGLRMNKTVAGTSRTFTWDTTEGIPMLLSDGINNYVYGPDNLPIEHISSGTVLYYQHDQLGSTRMLTDANGNVTSTAAYTPYGQAVASSGAPSPLGYAGQYTDSETGLLYMDHRYYDPGIGQFISRDPANSLTRSAYGYIGDDPLNGTDPLGLCWPSWACGVEHTVGSVATSVGSYVVQHPAQSLAIAAGTVAVVATGGAALAPESAAVAFFGGSSAVETIGAVAGYVATASSGAHAISTCVDHPGTTACELAIATTGMSTFATPGLPGLSALIGYPLDALARFGANLGALAGYFLSLAPLRSEIYQRDALGAGLQGAAC
jgi:RHS repeat-associated protein